MKTNLRLTDPFLTRLIAIACLFHVVALSRSVIEIHGQSIRPEIDPAPPMKATLVPLLPPPVLHVGRRRHELFGTVGRVTGEGSVVRFEMTSASRDEPGISGPGQNRGKKGSIWVNVYNESDIKNETGTLDELVTGQTVRVLFDGYFFATYPLQVDARTVTIEPESVDWTQFPASHYTQGPTQAVVGSKPLDAGR